MCILQVKRKIYICKFHTWLMDGNHGEKISPFSCPNSTQTQKRHSISKVNFENIENKFTTQKEIEPLIEVSTWLRFVEIMFPQHNLYSFEYVVFSFVSKKIDVPDSCIYNFILGKWNIHKLKILHYAIYEHAN